MSAKKNEEKNKLVKKNLFKRRWYRLMMVASSIVVFCTTYALILPAITLEKGCKLEEHTHTEACYEEVETTVLSCNEENLAGHKHTKACKNADGEYICGYADYVLHTHDEFCYDEDGELICELEELEEHTHAKDCYTKPAKKSSKKSKAKKAEPVEAAHTHTDDCYTLERGELICTEEESDGHTHTDDCTATKRGELTCTEEESDGHTHGKSCYETERECVCGEEESKGHTHGKSCYKTSRTLVCDDNSEEHEHDSDCYEVEEELVCDKEESEGHKHTDDCYEETETLVCDEEESDGHKHSDDCYERIETNVCGEEKSDGHKHTDDCYEWERVLSCDKEETKDKEESDDNEESDDEDEDEDTDEAEEAEPSLDCDEEEIVLHEHTDACFDADGNVICGKTQVLRHQHTEDCFTTETESTLVCTKEEHTHDDTCNVSSEKQNEKDTDSETDVSEDELDIPPEMIAEYAEGTNWIELRDSGWFEEYSDFPEENAEKAASFSLITAQDIDVPNETDAETETVLAAEPPSDVQIDERGGTTTSTDGVSVSKTIEGTELENVFDITLKVQTNQITKYLQEPDMAVVIVMDISNTMKDDFGSTTRYAAAMEAAEDFIDKFTIENSEGVSKIGYVAFNTDAHKIFDLQSCPDATQAKTLKNTMRTETGKIINADKYAESHSRFTNIEAGLKMGYDMLKNASNQYKFIIFLSDGFPTTYIQSGYTGYDPYDTAGRYFYDAVLGKKCLYGTSYSDKAAIKAREQATTIKASGITVFSIGVGVDGQTVQKHITSSENADGFSVVDRSSTTYEIGEASSTESYKHWLRDSIGSGYYYDSTDREGLKTAYDHIFSEIRQTVSQGMAATWVTTDPMPTSHDALQTMDFIGLYDQNAVLQPYSLTGSYAENAENTAVYDKDKHQILWDLKTSGYTLSKTGSITHTNFYLKYRVRLENEKNDFVENDSYPTNNPTHLKYRILETKNGQSVLSEEKDIAFSIPAVHGYLSDFTFTKKDNRGNILPGAEFTLSHDERKCSHCRGNKTSVDIPEKTAVSDATGMVSFTGIPSGHIYALKETQAPNGYTATQNHYSVTVAYDTITIEATAYDGQPITWDGTIVNTTYYELPATGGAGILPYTVGGTLLTAAALLLLYKKHLSKGGSSDL